MKTLSEQQRKVYELRAQGLTRAQVGEALGISPNTVRNHLKVIYRKLGVDNHHAALMVGLRAGLLVKRGAGLGVPPVVGHG